MGQSVERALALAALLLAAPQARGQQPPEPTGGTRLVLLGTGTPNVDPDRSGPALAIVSGGRAYLVDAGAGVVRRAESARRRGVAALTQPHLTTVFLTHLHSDHTLGLADLILTPWVLERTAPLQVYGPPGTRAMVEHLLAAYAVDVERRLDGRQPQNATGWRAAAHEIEPGQVYADDNVRVTAFRVPHGNWTEAYGYRFETRDRTIVISGDTRASDAVAEACHGCDMLVHEVYSDAGFRRLPRAWQRYHAYFHTSARDLGRVAARANPKLLVLYHQLLWSGTEADVLADVRRGFSGRVAFGNDLDVF